MICLTVDSTYRQLPDGPRRFFTSKAYAAAIAVAGGVPILAAEFNPEALARRCDALVLTGGDDLDPALYGETLLNDSVHVDPERDTFELSLTHAFLCQKKPILGICRGCQVLNLALGGDLYQDLPTQLGVQHLDSELRHPIICGKGSVLADLFGPHFLVNSTHHQSVRRIAPGLQVTARAKDGIIEAFESTNPAQLLWGVQFHPERLTDTQWDDRTPDFAPFFQSFVNAVYSAKP